MRYGIDVDGVIANWCKAYAKAMHQAPEPLSYAVLSLLERADYKSFAAAEEVVGATNWSWYWQEAAPNFRIFERMPPYRGQLEALAALDGEKFLITSTPRHLRAQRLAWLANNHVAVDGVLFVNRPEEKAEFINCLGIEHFVDDRLETITDLVNQTEARLYVYDQPWNRGVSAELNPGITRIKSLKELL